MNVGRMGHKMTTIGGKPTVIGGFDHGELKSIEEFDGTSWQLRSEKIEFATYVFASPDTHLLKHSQEEKNVQDISSSPCLYTVSWHSKSRK